MAKLKTPKIEELFDAGVHIGHQARRWHPKMEPYIYSAENKIHVFDLTQTEQLLKEACEFLYETAKKGSQIIFVGTKRQASETVKEAAKRSGALYVTERWLGGTITNFRMIKRNMEKLVSQIKKREEGALAKYTKKERLLIDREIDKLEKYVGGLVSLKGAPSAIVVVDPKKEKTVVREAVKSKIGVVALIDTNSDPSLITYPVPGNDDAIKSISLIMKAFADAVEEGYKEFAKIGDKVQEEVKIVEPAPTEIKPLTVSVDAKDVVIAEEVAAAVVDLPAVADVVTAPVETKPATKEKKVTGAARSASSLKKKAK
jgi:small subunit ribosomal protein S2